MMAAMRTRLTEDELAVREAFHDFFANESPPTTVRAAAEGTGIDRTLWDGLSAMGGPGMALPEAVGGAGASLTQRNPVCGNPVSGVDFMRALGR